MRPSRIASAAGWITRRTRHDRLLPGALRSEHGSVVFGVAVVALITRFHPHYGSTTHGPFSTTGLVVVAIVLVISFGVRWFMRNRRGLSGHAGADGGPGAADRVVVVVEDADEIGSGQDDPQLEGELGGVGAVWQLIAASRSAGFRDEQVAPLLLDAGYLVVDTARLGADLGGGSARPPARQCRASRHPAGDIAGSRRAGEPLSLSQEADFAPVA